MDLSNLSKITQKHKKRLGRGIGSGKGKTGGRGTKGQKARGTIPASFVGGSLPLYKKLPFRRGLGNRKISGKQILVKLSDLNRFKAKAVVNLESLIANGLVLERDAKKRGVKILAFGELKIPLNISLAVSKKVKELVEQVGGKVDSAS